MRCIIHDEKIGSIHLCKKLA